MGTVPERATRHASLIDAGSLENHYQPIVDLRSGRVLSFEVLGRLRDGAELVLPGEFLAGLTVDRLDALLFASLPPALAVLSAATARHPTLTASFNVSPLLMVRDTFAARVSAAVARNGIAPKRIWLETLENDAFPDVAEARAAILRLRAAGFSVVLDDVGRGFSSLTRLRELPVQGCKLDQDFVRDLGRRPEDLTFVVAMRSLARGLRMNLVIEGVETPEILHVLGVMGVRGAQGFAIARPMDAAGIATWLARHVPVPAKRQPETVLAAYGVHLGVVEACRALDNQALPVRWPADANDPHACAVGRWLDACGRHDGPIGLEHRHFHTLIDRRTEDRAAWEAASAALRQALENAVREEAATRDGTPVPPVAASPPAITP